MGFVAGVALAAGSVFLNYRVRFRRAPVAAAKPATLITPPVGTDYVVIWLANGNTYYFPLAVELLDDSAQFGAYVCRVFQRAREATMDGDRS